MKTAGALVALGISLAAIGWGPGVADPRLRVATIGLAFVAFAVGAWCVLRLPTRRAVPLLLAGGLALQLVALGGPPRSSDDVYRYVWDGRVQASGIDPYRYAPAAPELLDLRDPALWPAESNWCVSTVDVQLVAGCTLINRPAVHTIYPPVAEAYFVTVHEVSHMVSHDGQRSMRVAAALVALAVAGGLVLALGRLGRDPRRAVLWAWCPLVAIEAAGNGHVDVVAVLLTGIALFLLARGRSMLGGAVLGLAVGTKLTPALVVPAVLRRRPLAVLAALVGAVIAIYLPHVIAVGVGVLGYLPGYLREEGYADGSRFALLTPIVPANWAGPVAVVLLAAASLFVLRTSDPDQPWRRAALLTGVALLVTTPAYPWYGFLLVLLIAYGGHASWFAVAAAAYVAQYNLELGLSKIVAERLGYGLALLAVLSAWLIERRGPIILGAAPRSVRSLLAGARCDAPSLSRRA